MVDDDAMSDGSGTGSVAMLPAYEYVKRNILFDWFRVQSDYQEYARKKSLGQPARHETITARLLTMHRTMLKYMMLLKQFKSDYEEFTKKMDGYIKETWKIPEDDMDSVIDTYAKFLLVDAKLTNITYERKDWEEQLVEAWDIK